MSNMAEGLETRLESMESSLRRRLQQGIPAAGSEGQRRSPFDDMDDASSQSSVEERFRFSNLFSISWYLSVIWNSIHSATFASVFVILLMWASVFIYITFYFLYIPSLDLSRSIHFQFDSDCSLSLDHKCSIPHADIQLGQYKTPTLFAKGQQYRIRVDLNLPESNVNKEQGMFMIRLSLRDMNSKNIVTSARPSMLTYKSLPVKLIHTLFSWPLFLTGFKRESEDIQVPLIDDYVDGTRPAHGPASSARIELIARNLQVYSSTLIIQAHLTGLRYYMVNWPILTALFGIATIFAFLSLITICSINRVVRDDSADTEIIFSDDLISNSGSRDTDNEQDDNMQVSRQESADHPDEQPDSTS